MDWENCINCGDSFQRNTFSDGEDHGPHCSKKCLKESHEYLTQNTIMQSHILKAISLALGVGIKGFDIELDEELVDDSDSYSATFSFMPKLSDNPELGLVGAKKHSLQFDVEIDSDDNSVHLIWGEDDPVAVSAANIYASLYWHQITEAS